jgi:late competence protein required for DNA uptake (superfamily II DNA/RNA helicase)
LLYDLLQKHKHLAILKSSGIGATEFFLRYICWLATKDNELSNAIICIITGPRLELAVNLIDRLKGLFEPHDIIFSNKQTVLEFPNGRVEAFPSHNLSAMRGLSNVKLIFADEADYFQDEGELLTVVERYIGKSSPTIILCSTPFMSEAVALRHSQLLHL